MKLSLINTARCLIIALTIIIQTSSFKFKNATATVTPTDLIKNQVAAYPNTYEAPTTKEQIPLSNYTAPKLSEALYETDPTRKLRKNEFLEIIKYTFYKMTRGETEQMFNFIDMNKDDFVDHTEWDAFTNLYIYPFEACDTNKDNILNPLEYKACYDADPKSKQIEFRRRHQGNYWEIIMDAVSTRGVNELNFADYLFIKRALYGLIQCQSNTKFISKSHFRCALESSLPQKYQLKRAYDLIYDTGLRIAADRNLIQMDVITYLRIVYYTYVFGILNQPGDNAILEKQQWLKGIKEDRLPNNWEETEVETIFALINNKALVSPTNVVDQISFESWAFFFSLHRMFNKYSIKKPLKLHKEEFLQMLNDPFMYQEIRMAMDFSTTNFTESAYLQASLILQNHRINEKSFFKARFKQDASMKTTATNIANTTNSSYYTITPNVLNREIFFTTMVQIDKKYWLKSDMYRSFQLANLYVQMGMENIEKGENAPENFSWAISYFLDKLPRLYDAVVPPINMAQRSNLVFYKIFPSELHIDLLTFMVLENFINKFKIQSMTYINLVDETIVKSILIDFGMRNIPDTVIDTAQKGFDHLHRRQYVPMELAKKVLLVHATATEYARSNNIINFHKLNVNNEPGRKYPYYYRRVPSSPMV